MRENPSGSFDVWEAVDGLREAFVTQAASAKRRSRGDIRSAILVALLAEPMHGYQLIQAIEAESGGAWKPSPGSVYPTLQLLADEQLVTSEQVGERKVYALTEAGRAAATTLGSDDASGDGARGGRDFALPKAGAKLAQAAGQVLHNGTPEQTERAVAILDDARRKLYAILAEG